MPLQRVQNAVLVNCRQPSHRSVGLMDKASAPGAGDSRFESWADQCPRKWGAEWELETSPKSA